MRVNNSRRFSVQNFFKLITQRYLSKKKFPLIKSATFSDIKPSDILTLKIYIIKILPVRQKNLTQKILYCSNVLSQAEKVNSKKLKFPNLKLKISLKLLNFPQFVREIQVTTMLKPKANQILTILRKIYRVFYEEESKHKMSF